MVTSLLFEVTYKFINGSFAFSLGQIYILILIFFFENVDVPAGIRIQINVVRLVLFRFFNRSYSQESLVLLPVLTEHPLAR